MTPGQTISLESAIGSVAWHLHAFYGISKLRASALAGKHQEICKKCAGGPLDPKLAPMCAADEIAILENLKIVEVDDLDDGPEQSPLIQDLGA